MKTGYLVLEDNTVIQGRVFGYPPPQPEELALLPERGTHGGELVFNTGMAGYQEILTDPSYSGQIIVMTYPHIGNYGTDENWNEYGPGTEEKQDRMKASGLIVRSIYCGPPAHGRMSLDEFLREHERTGLSEIDTRHLTLRIREEGNPLGVFVGKDNDSGSINPEHVNMCLDYLYKYPRMEGRNLVSTIGTRSVAQFNPDGSPHVALVDCGVKAGIIRDLSSRGCRVSLVPNGSTGEEVLALKPDCVLFSNGPGDPAVLTHLIQLARYLLNRIPLLGICLGHQLISLALGASTFKMKYGHHGVNNPVRNETDGTIHITSQNHGFSVDEGSLPTGCRIWFRNANDGTVEGLSHERLPLLTVQFHPEAAPGPRDSGWIFDSFLAIL